LVGILSGMSFALFFVSRNMLILACAEYNQDVESVYWGAIGVITSILTIVLPLLAGITITYMESIELGMIGYYIIFSIGVLMLFVSLAFTFSLSEPPAKNAESKLWSDAKVLLKKKSVIFSGLGEMFRGTRDVISGFIFFSLVFYVTQNEAMVGTYSTVMAICKLAGFYIIARYLNLKRAKKFLAIFAIIAAVTPVLLLFYSTSLWALFVVGGMAFALLSFQNGANIICSNAIRGYVECGFLIREIFLTIGRMIGLPILLILSGSSQSVAVALVILGFMQIFTWLMHSRVKFKEVSN